MGKLKDIHESMKSTNVGDNYGKINVTKEHIKGGIEKNIQHDIATTGHALYGNIPHAESKRDMTKQAEGFQTTKGETTSEKIVNKGQSLFKKALSFFQPHHEGKVR